MKEEREEERRLRRGKSALFRSRFPRFIISARLRDFLGVSPFFLISSTRKRKRLQRTTAKNEIPWSGQKFSFPYVIALKEVSRNALVPAARKVRAC